MASCHRLASSCLELSAGKVFCFLPQIVEEQRRRKGGLIVISSPWKKNLKVHAVSDAPRKDEVKYEKGEISTERHRQQQVGGHQGWQILGPI